MKKFLNMMALVLAIVCVATMFAVPALAESADVAEVAEAASTNSDAVTTAKAFAAAIAIAVVAAVGALAMGLAISKSVESIARQPEASENIRGSLMIGLVFIETAIIYALIVAILVVFVL